MSNWNAAHYLTYADERIRAAVDLAARIRLNSPTTIADLGCGPGNSTQILRDRWPAADILGIDNSAEMLDSAKKLYPDQKWELADVSNWKTDRSFDLLYSNAALQWIPNHDTLMPRLFAMVSSGGALAFQIPSSTYATVRKLIHDISREAKWNDQMRSPRNALTMREPSFYYDELVTSASHLDIWETEYFHIMNSKVAIVDWIASTGLRPFLAVLENERERHDFLNQLHERVNAAYEFRRDGKVLYPFRRTFVIAYK
ncbi:MAG: methyltransferase domain-containing protein [Planctomycetales bacterium]|nr:methyltransferase domain-containing protein [Planctomycetales bacterium]